MADITIKDATPEQLAMLGDAAFKAGNLGLARGFYGALARAQPGAVGPMVRQGMTHRPNARRPKLLEVLQLLESVPGAQAFVGEGIATWFKNPPFAADAKFMTLAAQDEAIAPSGVFNWHWNLQVMLNAAQQAKAIPGDYVELGVYKGHTTKFLADYLDFATWDRNWWLYDTFEGVPADQRDPGREGMTATVYGESFTFEEVRDRFATYGNIRVIKGRVPDVFAQGSPGRIAFIHIDLNNAAAEIGALDALYDRLSPGGVIVFDDFCWSTSHAQYRAEMAWFQARGLNVFPLPTGQGLFIKPPA
ncbi:MAG: class I SAM-dependent methyltransferase [Phenylobacterium sp.]|uniref:TylF/MycF/NovP-related O-methyltransferase n=1 Tax=Phenylobacterium sp. TaxID=1871053 RepID=UPI001A51EC70|nr:TylF/MycF/NovP-related O-methyltransferase [Phenylobacterium sp.]MBL8553898.1 class I SAM-dependent methyltransferase [Phenylobacterium sp.]